MNDPFELLSYRLPMPEPRNSWLAARKTFGSQYGVICFCKSWGNPVMWSHYAEYHSGLALGFDIDDRFLNRVKYIKNRRNLPISSDLSANTRVISNALKTKFKHWEYEQEYRRITELGEPDEVNGLYFLPFKGHMILREVIIGPKSKVTSDQIMDAYSSEPISVITSRIGFRDFKVVQQKKQSLWK
ncbi:DUF2971 domain-containing protein [Gymnodinialimonas sp.]